MAANKRTVVQGGRQCGKTKAMSTAKTTITTTTKLTLELTAADLEHQTLTELLTRHKFEAKDITFIGFKVPYGSGGDFEQLSTDCPLYVMLEKTCTT